MTIELGWAVIDKKTLYKETGHAYYAGCKLYSSKKIAIASMRDWRKYNANKEKLKELDSELENKYHFILVSVKIPEC